MPNPIDFYFDFSSPYAYLLARDLTHLAQRHQRSVNWHPILLGAVFKQTGRRPPIDDSTRGQYLRHDIQRVARRKGLYLRWPESFPFSSLPAVRAFYWLQQISQKRAQHFAAALLDQVWIEGTAVDTPESLIAVAERLDVDTQAMLAAIQTDPIKDLARQSTEAAMQRGVFGAPMVFIDDEPFWGNDRLDDMTHWLETGGF